MSSSDSRRSSSCVVWFWWEIITEGGEQRNDAWDDDSGVRLQCFTAAWWHRCRIIQLLYLLSSPSFVVVSTAGNRWRQKESCLDTEGSVVFAFGADLECVEVCTFLPTHYSRSVEGRYPHFLCVVYPACSSVSLPVAPCLGTDRENTAENSFSEQHISPQERLWFHLEQCSSSQEHL